MSDVREDAGERPSGEKDLIPRDEPIPRGRHFRSSDWLDGADGPERADVPAPGDRDDGVPAMERADARTDASLEADGVPKGATSGPDPEDGSIHTGANAALDEEPAWPSLEELPQRRRRSEESIRRHKRERLLRRLRVVGVIMLVLAVVTGGAALAVAHMIEEGGRSLKEASRPQDIKTVEEADTQDEGLTVEYQGKKYRYNENIVSIVVMGYDRRQDVSETGAAGQADAIMVVAMDTRTGEMRVIGVPRDTMVDVDENVGDAFLGQEKMQIALAFSYGDGYETSAQNVVRAVSRVLYNMPMNYYFALDMNGIGPINDAAGGVTLTPLSSIPNTGIVKDVPIKLYGTNAMRYVQYRDTSQLTSSLDRQARQSQYLKAFFSQAMSNAAGDPGILVGLYQTATEYSTTNLELSEFSYLAATLVEHGMSELDVVTLAGEPVKGSQYVEYHLDQDAVYETVLDVFYTPVEEGAPEPTAATE